MNSTTSRLLHDTVQTTVRAAEFADLANGPYFPQVTWTTMIFHSDQGRLSAYGHKGAVDHHLTVTGLDSKDEKRVVEVLAALNVASEEDIRRALQAGHIFQSFVRPF